MPRTTECSGRRSGKFATTRTRCPEIGQRTSLSSMWRQCCSCGIGGRETTAGTARPGESTCAPWPRMSTTKSFYARSGRNRPASIPGARPLPSPGASPPASPVWQPRSRPAATTQIVCGRLGYGNDPRYNKTVCFDPFPFPDVPAALRREIARVAEHLGRHRREALDRDVAVTMTGMYNVVEKLRAGHVLSPAEQRLHVLAACGVLRELHDSLDTLAARAYGWEWPLPDDGILDRLVRLHDERIEEEAAGQVRWLRPDYQVPRFAEPGELGLEIREDAIRAPRPPGRGRAPQRQWPESVVDQVLALKSVLTTDALTADGVFRRFRGARRDLIGRHLETLALMGEVREGGDGRYSGTSNPGS